MAQIYCAYFARFVDDDEELQDFLLDLLTDDDLFDWQRMWIVATLNKLHKAADKLVKAALGILMDGNRHNGLRAVAAIFVGRFGDAGRRNALFKIYPDVPDYVQLAIYFSTREWPSVERSKARSSWGGQGALNRLMSSAISNRARRLNDVLRGDIRVLQSDR